MSKATEVFKKITGNAFSLFVYGELGDVDSRRGITTKHTRSQERRFDIAKKLITRANVWLLKASKGRLGNSFLGRPVLLLTTIGRKTGQPRTQPLFFVEDGPRLLLVASNGGSPDDPVWVLNATANPRVTVSRSGIARPMRFRIADAAEKARLWPQMTTAFPYWQEVADRSHRDFPVVILEPLEEEPAPRNSGQARVH